MVFFLFGTRQRPFNILGPCIDHKLSLSSLATVVMLKGEKLVNMCLELRFHLKNTEATRLSFCITVVFANMPQNKTYAAAMLNQM